MADTKISALTTDSAPHRTNDFAPTYDASAVATKKVALKDFGVISLYGGFANTAIADATTYYFGPFRDAVLFTGDNTYVWDIHRAGIITRVSLRIITSGGTSETSTLYLRKNGTTDTVVTSTFTTNTSGVTTVSGLALSVAVGDTVGFKWVSPSYATNPSVYGFVTVILE
jgi:hypothetical protein